MLPLWKFGITGTGVGVAVVDTGVDGSLPDFASKDHGHSRVVASAVANTDATTATDSYGHGTDVAGIIAGDGDNRGGSDPQYGQYIGVAPNANLVSVKVSDETGATTVLDVIYGLQFAVEHQATYNIRVINLSLELGDAAVLQDRPARRRCRGRLVARASSWSRPPATAATSRAPCSTRRPTIPT